LIAHSHGKGRALLCAYPLESYLGSTPAGFDGPQLTQEIYRAFGVWTGVEPLFQTDQPSVEAAGLVGRHRGYVVLANHAPEQKQVTLKSRLPIGNLQLLSPSAESSQNLGKGAWELSIPGYDGLVLHWILS
jgi:hypothetical protein